MKKYLLTAMLTFIGFVGFSSAGTVCTSDGFTNQNVEITYASTSSIELDGNTYYEYDFDLHQYCPSHCYILFNSTSPTIQYYGNGWIEGQYSSVSSFPFVVSHLDGDAFMLYSSSNVDSVFANLSFSTSPITCTSSSEGDNSGGSLLPNGESDLSGIITGLNSTITEFIPYLVYLGLGIITVIIGFVAIRWLINRTQAKIRGTFSSGRRRK